MLERTEQKIAGAAIGLAGVILGSLVVGIALHTAGQASSGSGPKPDGKIGIHAGSGVKDTPIVMEGGSIVFDSDTAWAPTTATTFTTNLLPVTDPQGGTQPGRVKRIRVVDLSESTDILQPVKPASGQTWTVTLYVAGTSEFEVISGTDDAITVTPSANAQTVLSDGNEELTIFPSSGSNKIGKIGVALNGVAVTGSPVACSTGSGTSTELYRCFVHFKIN